MKSNNDVVKNRYELYRKSWYDMLEYLSEQSTKEFEPTMYKHIRTRMQDIYKFNIDKMKSDNKYL